MIPGGAHLTQHSSVSTVSPKQNALYSTYANPAVKIAREIHRVVDRLAGTSRHVGW